MSAEDRLQAMSCWTGPIEAEPLGGGITNRNFLVTHQGRKAVVRIGDDIPVHQILRFNELAASQAAYAAGVSPKVLHHEPGALVIDYIEGRTFTAEDLQQRGNLAEALALVAKAHREIPKYLRGPALVFWVFHVLRDYAGSLKDANSRHLLQLPSLLGDAEKLQQAVGPIDLVFGHNDLLPANFLHDGNRLWLIDWDYAGFNSPLFDLGGLAANNALTPEDEAGMLTTYYQREPDAQLWRAYRAMKAAAALRETMWSMISEIHSELDFDFAGYTATNLETYRAAWAAFEASHG